MFTELTNAVKEKRKERLYEPWRRETRDFFCRQLGEDTYLVMYTLVEDESKGRGGVVSGGAARNGGWWCIARGRGWRIHERPVRSGEMTCLVWMGVYSVF